MKDRPQTVDEMLARIDREISQAINARRFARAQKLERLRAVLMSLQPAEVLAHGSR